MFKNLFICLFVIYLFPFFLYSSQSNIKKSEELLSLVLDDFPEDQEKYEKKVESFLKRNKGKYDPDYISSRGYPGFTLLRYAATSQTRVSFLLVKYGAKVDQDVLRILIENVNEVAFVEIIEFLVKQYKYTDDDFSQMINGENNNSLLLLKAIETCKENKEVSLNRIITTLINNGALITKKVCEKAKEANLDFTYCDKI